MRMYLIMSISLFISSFSLSGLHPPPQKKVGGGAQLIDLRKIFAARKSGGWGRSPLAPPALPLLPMLRAWVLKPCRGTDE